MSNKTPYYITTAISYVNGAPHLGHAYEDILTDIMARFKRLDGFDVMFLTGTDEHGQKVAKTAEKNGKAPQEFCDEIAQTFIQLKKDLNISNDDFIRTTENRHYEAAKDLWLKIKNAGDIYLDSYAGWYSTREEAFFSEKELKVDEKTGEKRTPNDTEVEWMEESSYFFKLSAYQDKLLAHYEAHPEFIQPASRRNEVISFVKGGLEDLSISRTTFNWGIPVPEDDEHVMYVWLDALTNYMTAIGYPDIESEGFKKYWPADVHVIGKDIIRFHCVFWPAFLMSAGIDLPKQVFAHGFINVDGQKMSKSLGNVVSPTDLIEKYGLDQTRYILAREISHGEDGNFTYSQALNRLNSDLANGLGNLAQRSLSMIYKNCDAKMPARENLTEQDTELLEMCYSVIPKLRDEADKFRFNRVLEEIWRIVYAANAYIDDQAPWTLKKTDHVRMGVVLSVIAETVRCLGIMLQPFMPQSCKILLDQVGVDENQREFSHISGKYALSDGYEVEKPEGVFPRIQIEEDNDA
ncbi:MAG: methionine--tRNA ligase [Alphaproteobacteria bacterium]|nr:methionine--tRNA ligase [Alphaproteobacteria bacterium]